MIMPRAIARVLLLTIIAGLPHRSLNGQVAPKLREPLPFDVATSLRTHNSRSTVDISPDGEWVAHTVQGEAKVPRDTLSTAFAATGFPFAEGDSRMQATLSHTKTGEVIALGNPASASWAPVWSPDGRRVAFYSDEGGEAGVWVFELATRRATRFPGVIARPFFGFEHIQWSSDSQRLLCKLLPAHLTIAQANALGRTRTRTASLFAAVGAGQPSVHVRRVDPKAVKPAPDAPSTTATRGAPVGDVRWMTADLALLDLRTQRVTRLVEGAAVRAYAFAPNQGAVAYTVHKGAEPNTQQPNVDLLVKDLAGGAARVLAENARMGYGIEWSWSPDSKRIAYISSGQLASGEIVVLSVADGAERRLQPDSAPNFGAGEGEYAPLWSANGRQIFALGGGKLWRIDVSSGNGAALGNFDGWVIRTTITPFGRPTIWSNDGERSVWVVAANRGNTKAGIHAIDLRTGKSRLALEEVKSYSALFNVDANETTGDIAFVSTDQQHMQDVWMFNTKDGTTRQASRLNESLDRYELGQARVIEWKTPEGESLRGALLLPPGYNGGKRLPLVVFVYGGESGSRFVNRFGLWGSMPMFNMHLFATRGFAVLYPDAPVKTGQTMTDVVRNVMPGVDAAIAQGYADADRLVVMGQSYGSYNTLSIITQTDRFKAAIITAAVLHPDLFADYLRATGYYEHGQGNMGGTIWEQRDRYFANSPLLHFDRIQTPLLIGQGERDGDLVAADAIFTALERLGKPVEYRLYQGEGHVLSQPPNVIDFWKRRLEFVAEHLDLVYDATGSVVFDGSKPRSRGSRVSQ
jgi:dipeptidyl aminopeptidase/acylaminoacyl peptidase